MVEVSFPFKKKLESALFQLSPRIKNDIAKLVINAEAEGEKDILMQISVKVIRKDGSELEYNPFKIDIGVPQT